MDKAIKDLAKNVAGRYGKSLSLFRPCKPGSELLEQNLITLLCHEFMVMFNGDESCMAYSEIPFKSEKHPDNWSNRLDGFLANTDTAYLVEAKSSRHKDDLIADIKADLDRIHSNALQQSFVAMASTGGRSYQIPKDVYGVIIADFWSLKDSSPWFASGDEFAASLQPDYSVSAVQEKIGTYGRYDYFLIVSQTENLNW